MQRWRQVGVGQHLGVAADGGQRRAQLVRNIADELVLALLFDGQVVLLLLRGLHQLLEVHRQLIGLKHAPVGFERDVGAVAVRGRLLRQIAERLGQEMPDEQA